MTPFAQKISRLTINSKKTRISRLAGMYPTAISDIVTRGYIPRADAAARLANVLGVELNWLLSDAAKWPPVRVERCEPDADAGHAVTAA